MRDMELPTGKGHILVVCEPETDDVELFLNCLLRGERKDERLVTLGDGVCKET
jgi:hypothetical protein